MRTDININPNIILWAISRAGYDLQMFIDKSPHILHWIEKKKNPTVKQLEDFSQKVHLPFGYLFLETPPKEDLPIPFFRSGKKNTTNVSLNVYDTIILIQRRQEWLANYLKDEKFEQLNFVSKFNRNTNYLEIVADIRKVLGLENEWASSFKTWEQALEHLTQKIEDAGIIVVFNGVVGNNTHRPVNVEECRGFVLVDSMAPFMFVNAADAKAAQMFTIIHELAHIWTGHSAGFDFRKLQPANDPVELLCNKVAAEFLVPERSLINAWQELHDIKKLASFFKVSTIVLARRLMDLGKISKYDFFRFYNAYIDQIKQKRESQSGGGDFYATQKKRLSLRFFAHINQAVKENKLLFRDAYQMTGLKGDTYQKFANKHL